MSPYWPMYVHLYDSQNYNIWIYTHLTMNSIKDRIRVIVITLLANRFWGTVSRQFVNRSMIFSDLGQRHPIMTHTLRSYWWII